MKLRPEEVTSVIRREIEAAGVDFNVDEVGTVLEVGDGIARVYGLENVMASEMVEFENGSYGLAFNLEEDSVGVVILGRYFEIKEGQQVKRTKRVLEVPTGKELLGRVVTPMGEPIDGRGPINTTQTWPLEYHAPGIADRQPVNEPLQTGIKAIDSMIPIGRGQRELIIGDRETGKTAIMVDTIINQKDSGVICVYVAIGQKASTVAGVVEKLREHGAMDNTIIVAATAVDPAPMQYIAPYSGCAMAEHFMYRENRHTVCFYDDLTKQAAAYRQLSLLLRRPPGREAYPGDIFYCHSRLLERATKLSDDLGGGSLTGIPVIETQEGDLSYIPTNVISITDGQIFLYPELFYSGIRPAIHVGVSVSRVGGKAQVKAMKSVAGGLRIQLAQFRELEAFAQLGTELDAETRFKLDRGERITEVLKQGLANPMPVAEQVAVIYAATQGHLDRIPLERCKDWEEGFLDYLRAQGASFLEHVASAGEMTAVIEEELKGIIKSYNKTFK